LYLTNEIKAYKYCSYQNNCKLCILECPVSTTLPLHSKQKLFKFSSPSHVVPDNLKLISKSKCHYILISLYDAARFLRLGSASHLFGVEDELFSGGTLVSVRTQTACPHAICHSGFQIKSLALYHLTLGLYRDRGVLGVCPLLLFDRFPF